MKFIPYEDVPIAFVREGSEEYVFAESATLSVSQPLEINRQLDDNIIQICSYDNNIDSIQYSEQTFSANIDTQVTLGPSFGPAQPIATSIYKIAKDTKITFPNNKHLYFFEDIYPNGHDYMVNVYSTSGGWTLTEGEAQSGYFEPIYKYSATNGVQGTLDVDFYLDTGNLSHFFNITGLFQPDTYPPIDEDYCGIILGNFSITYAYLKSFNFSVSPNSISQASASFDVYGDINRSADFEFVHAQNFPNYYKNKSIAHGQNTNFVGLLDDLDMEHPISFNYGISVDRLARYDLPTGTYETIDGLIPSRVSKKSTQITMSIQGENFNPSMTTDNYFGGKGANLKVNLYDLSYDNFETDSDGYMHTFQVSGVVNTNSLSVSSDGYLNGEVSVSQILK